jgi:hypothetical protein
MIAEFALNLPVNWASGDFYYKQGMQSIVFPSGVRWFKQKRESLSNGVNSIFEWIAHEQKGLAEAFEKRNAKIGDNFAWVYLREGKNLTH